jgi:hypothetical protein
MRLPKIESARKTEAEILASFEAMSLPRIHSAEAAQCRGLRMAPTKVYTFVPTFRAENSDTATLPSSG